MIEKVIGDFIERVHNNINSEKDFVVTGKIAEMTIKVEGNMVNVYGNPWLLYQDRGVNGSVLKKYDTPHSFAFQRPPPVYVFKQWIKQKGINYRNNEKYSHEKHPLVDLADDERKLNSAAWALATKGIRPRKIYSKEIPKLVDDLKQGLAGFCIQQISQQINVHPHEGGGNRIVVKM